MTNSDATLTREAETRTRKLLAHARARCGLVIRSVEALRLQHDWTRPIVETQDVQRLLVDVMHLQTWRTDGDLHLLATVAVRVSDQKAAA